MTVTFEPGESTANLNLTINNDNDTESNENFTITITGDGRFFEITNPYKATVIIMDDDKGI